jgi:hypothetical protein
VEAGEEGGGVMDDAEMFRLIDENRAKFEEWKGRQEVEPDRFKGIEERLDSIISLLSQIESNTYR